MLKVDDWCVIRKDFYQDYGKVIRVKGEITSEAAKKDIPKIMRKATVHDKSIAHENEMRSKSAHRTAQKYVETLKLPMKLLNAHYSFDGKLVTVQFTAEGRVDFRELVKELSQALNTRIELRQIGVRDETAIHGGLGICGQELCCHRFLTEFASINVRMAKDQDLSLTPSTISGACGRLKCCLKYEHEGYLELEKTMPRRGDMCECKEGRGKICDRNLLTQQVVVHMEESGNVLCCHRSEVRVVYPEKFKIGKKIAIEPELDENDEAIKKLED
jgi:cell fate regulator YaaT (PSP1 superfamily)